jgi:hypothetical protein
MIEKQLNDRLDRWIKASLIVILWQIAFLVGVFVGNKI